VNALRFGLLVFLAALAVAPPGIAPASEARRGEDAEASATPPKLVIDTQGFTTQVNSLDFSPRGDLVAAAGSDKVVRLWDVATGRLRDTLRGYDDDAGHGRCKVVRFSPDGRWLLVGVQDFTTEGVVRVYDAADPGEIRALLPGHAAGGVNTLAFSADGRYLATGGANGGILFWDWPGRRPLGEVAGSPERLYFGFPTALPLLVVYDAQGLHVFSAPHARDLNQVAAVDRGRLAPPDVLARAYASAQALGPALARIEGQFPDRGRASVNRYFPAETTGAGARALFGGEGHKNGQVSHWVGLWDLDGRLVRIYEGHAFLPSALALSRDGALTASADALGNIDLWETQTGRLRYRLAGKGKAVYAVAFDASGGRLAFGTTPHSGDRWAYNHYSTPDQTFDLQRRALSHTVPPLNPPPPQRLGDRALQFARNPQDAAVTFTTTLQGRVEGIQSLSPGITPLCFGYLRTSGTGIENLLMIGSDDNGLAGHDPRDTIRGRMFVGHNGPVYAFGESTDGRLLVSGSSDRTICLWSLGPVVDMGWPDFDTFGNGVVSFLKPGGNAERAGVRRGDTFTKIDGRDTGTIYDRMLKGLRDYAVGQQVTLELTRGGVPYQVRITLAPGGDFVTPLLTLFVADEEWVLWTPSGYYDASPGGDRLIGWHQNRGRGRSARFYTAHQFRKTFYRPDVIDRIFETGDATAGVRLANQERAGAGGFGAEALDLRKLSDLLKVEPPRVEVAEPRPGARIRGRSVTVRAAITADPGKVIGAVKVLVNGHPVAAPGGAPGDAANRRSIALDVELEPGRNSIAVIATDLKSKSSSQPQGIVVYCDAPAPAGREKRRAFVLALGISSYARRDYNLDFAHADARSFAAAWNAQAGSIYSEVRTKLLVNEECTVAGIHGGFDWLARNVGPRDYAVLFIAAHGITSESTGGYYVASYDLDASSLAKLRPTAIADQELIDFVEDLHSHRTLVFLDICHAGGIERARPGTARSRRPRNSSGALRELTSDEIGAVMFGSCGPREKSNESEDWSHGAFTKVVLDAFADSSIDRSADGLLSIDELRPPLERRVADLVARLFGDEQHPSVYRPPGVEDFPFFTFTRAGRPTTGR
jgi:WD40 repeat protein